MLLSGNQENQSSFDPTPSGLAGDASKAITQLISSSGTVATESANATTRISKYKDDLVKLEDRMTRVLARYNKQFATMDSLVGQTKSTQTGLTSSFAGLMAMYTNK
jgi:flagellar capping protein FliD